MMNQPVKAAEKTMSDVTAKTMATAQQFRDGFGETAGAAMDAVKSEVDQFSRATRDAAKFVGAEVGKRPLTYTLAAAGAGALAGVALMALLNRPRH